MSEPFSAGEKNGVIQAGEILLLITSKSAFQQEVESLGLGTIMKKESGEPYLSESACYLSITHKGDLCMAAVSLAPVGVDTEDVTVPRNVERLSRLFSESEIPADLYAFYRIWTAKEAVGKRRGTGVTQDLLKEKTEGVRYVEYGNYLIAVAGEGEIRVRERI